MFPIFFASMFESREGRATRERERIAELRSLCERIARTPSPPEVLEARTEQEFLKLLEAAPPFAGAKELWKYYRESMGFSVGGGKKKFVLPTGETAAFTDRKLNRLEKLRDKIKASLSNEVIEELRLEPFIAGDVYYRGVKPCPECQKLIPMRHRMVYRNSPEHPAPMDLSGEEYEILLDEPSSTRRVVSNQDLHEIDEHPYTSKLRLDDWKAFFGRV